MGYTISWHPLRFTDYTYQNIVAVIPKVISPECGFKVEPFGIYIGNDINNSIVFRRDALQAPWEKTNRMPYTKDAMKALILMVEYGVTEQLNHDDSSMEAYLDALDEVHQKHPLVSYAMQKRYFYDVQRKKMGVYEDEEDGMGDDEEEF